MGSSLPANRQHTVTNLTKTIRTSCDGASKIYSLNRVGGFNKTFCVNHRRTTAELRMCRLSASNLIEEEFTLILQLMRMFGCALMKLLYSAVGGRGWLKK